MRVCPAALLTNQVSSNADLECPRDFDEVDMVIGGRAKPALAGPVSEGAWEAKRSEMATPLVICPIIAWQGLPGRTER
ncbi:hypothetical protein ATY81_03350 [Rhizobium sp. R72]|nr:hypothetical protein ATY81_03350 [Rhizobium sp. R72]OWW06068.1 hypothetical protein ATY80_03350 [Rhizobium sp. R711]